MTSKKLSIHDTDIEALYEYGYNNDWKEFDNLKNRLIQTRLNNCRTAHEKNIHEQVTHALASAELPDGTPLIDCLVSNEDRENIFFAVEQNDSAIFLETFTQIRQKALENTRFALYDITASKMASQAVLKATFTIEHGQEGTVNDFIQNKFDMAIDNDDIKEINVLEEFACDIRTQSCIKLSVPSI